MIKQLKKLFTPITKISDSELKNKEIIEELNKIIYLENIEEILFSPNSKLYILNVYHDTFDDFLNNILNNNINRSIISINIFAYFKNKENIQYKLKRTINILKDNNIDVKIQYEFTELINSINFLKSLEN